MNYFQNAVAKFLDHKFEKTDLNKLIKKALVPILMLPML
ncbi:hypothetical protein EV145_103217 [Flavobacterium sp. 245]|nr:hypothetical protein EV145_103217 [Flavobacterium sp. 245]